MAKNDKNNRERDKLGLRKFPEDWNPNPTGKGGFADNPQHRNLKGGWNKDDSISYWYRKLMQMNPFDFQKFKPSTMAQKMAKQAVSKATARLDYLQEVTNRTEGRVPQTIDHTNAGDKFELSPDERTAKLLAVKEAFKKILKE